MKIYVPNLKRRPDKRAAMETYLSTYNHAFRFINSHDAENYANTECLLDAMRCAGWELQDLHKLNITDLLGEKDQARIPIRVMPHLAFRWTYLDILRGICLEQTPALILIDDMYLPYPPETYEALIDKLTTHEGHLLALDPITESSETDFLIPFYHAPTEEAIYWTVEGAKTALELLLQSPEKVIGDIIRHRYPQGKAFSTAKLMAKGIGNKKDWNSDIHINSESKFR